MKLHSFLSVLLASSGLVALCSSCSHDSHDHEPKAQAQASEPEPVRHLRFGKQWLVFLEHPPLVKSQPARFLAHFSVLESGEPVREGRVQILLGEQRIETDKPAREGLFIPEGAVAVSGKQRLQVVLENGPLREVFDLGIVEVHENERLVPTAQTESAADAVGFTFEQQWSVGLLVRPAGEGEVRLQREFPGVLEFDDNAKATVSAGVGGLLVAIEGQRLPRAGERVEQGTLLGWIEPLLSASDAAQLRVWELEARLLEQESAHELELARVQLALAEREQVRAAGARERGLATQAQEDQARSVVAEARLRLEAATTRREALKAREALRTALRVPVSAPISGVISEWCAVPGEQVQPGDAIARLVDPQRVRVRAHIPEEALGTADSWQALELSPVLLESAPVRAERAELVLTAELDRSTRSLAGLLRPRELPSAWKPGMLLSIRATQALTSLPVTVPAQALVLDQGLSTVYVMVGGEQFQRRVVKVGARDSQRVAILSGLSAGEQVVTRGAHFVRLASMAPEGFGHGHAH